LKYINGQTGLELSISDNMVQEMINEGRIRYPAEFGGVLVGRYSGKGRLAIVEQFILPVKYSASKYHFERDSVGLYEQLTVFYQREPSLIYIGEWHTHPNAPPVPSNTDLKAMRELANDQNVMISNPILLIIGITAKKSSVGAYFFTNNKLLKYEKNGST
jgi:integrative and conjugative element protein (TIGR02256 family)